MKQMTQLREQLNEMAEESYAQFSLKLLPNLSQPLLGVRLPVLRKLAKEITKSNDIAAIFDFLQEESQSFEETMIQGMVIGYMKCTLTERLQQIADFVPKIDNWSICDCFCGGLKFTKKHQFEVYEFLQPYFFSSKEFEQRFAYVMAMDYFLTKPYLNDIYQKIQISSFHGYYSQMAVAWCLATAYITYPEDVFLLLQTGCLDRVTQQKTIQKIRESYRISATEKERVKNLTKGKP